MTIPAFGWHDFTTPYITTVNLELMLGEAGAYTDIETARALTAEALLAAKASPTFTGTVSIPTPTPGDNTTKAASTAFVTAAIAAGGGGAVSSVFTRTGAVTAQTGDYTAAQVGADVSGVSATETIRAEAAEALLIPLAQKGAASGVATLTAGSVLTSNQIPAAVVQVTGQTTGQIPSWNGTIWTPVANTSAVETARAEAAEALLAPLASAALTGVPTAPTAPINTNTTQIATTAFVLAAITPLISSPPPTIS